MKRLARFGRQDRGDVADRHPSLPWSDVLLQDLRMALRSLRRNRGFAAATIITLALGIGANAAIFSVVYPALLQPLRYAEPDQIFSVETIIPDRQDQVPSLPMRIQDFLEWRGADTAFSAVAALTPSEWNLTGTGDAQRVGGARVSANFFAFLGVPVAFGRGFRPEEEQPGRDRVVVISDALWRSRHGGSPAVLNSTIFLNGESHVVVGIAPPALLVPTGPMLHPSLAFAPRMLASAALMLHSFVNVTRVDRGYAVEHVLALELSPGGQRYATGPQRTAFYQGLLTEVQALPGVLAAGAVSSVPALGESATQVVFFSTDTDSQSLALQRPVAGLRTATPGYFTASGTALRAGRAFTAQDVLPVAVIGESLGRRLWPGEPPASLVGRTIRQGAVSSPDITVVGVAEDVRPGAADRELPPQLYRPHHQVASGRMSLVVRTAQDPSALSASAMDHPASACDSATSGPSACTP